MASSENSSPSKFLGKPWSVWASYALNLPTEVTDPVEISHAESGNTRPDSNLKYHHSEEDANVMKLKMEDKPMFGICPMRDECYLVFCEKCEQVVKSQAMTKHYQLRHGRPPDRSPEPDLPSHQFHFTADHLPSHSDMSRRETESGQSGSPLHRRDSSPLERLHPQEEITKSPAPEIRTDSDSTPTHRKHQMANPEGQVDDETTSAIASIEQEPMRGMTPPTEQSYDTPHGTPPSPQLSSNSGNITDQFQVNSGKASPHNHMLPELSQKSSSPQHPEQMVTSSSPDTLHKSEKVTKRKSSTPPNPSKPKKSSTRKRKISGIRNEKNIPCKDRQFDANKHCGVWLEDTQRPCTHSLTCKTHSLYLRRAVKGRRASFDELLAEHKKVADAERAAKLAVQKQDLKSSLSTSQKIAHSQSTAKSEASQSHKTGQPPGIPQLKSSVVLDSSVPQKRSNSSATHRINSPSSQVRHGISPSSKGGGDTPSSSRLHPTKASVALRSPKSDGSGVKEEADIHGPNASNPTEQLYAGHPLPSAMCTFGAKTVGGSRQVFSRKMAPLRKAFLCLLDQQLNPSATTARKQSRSQEAKHTAKLSRHTTVAASSKSSTNRNISHLRTAADNEITSPVAIPENIYKNSKPVKRPVETKPNLTSKVQKVNQSNCVPQVLKSKARRKSVTKISKMTQNSNVPTSTPATVTVAPNVVSVVPSNGIQAIDLSQGLYSIDASSELPLSVLKNLRFVVTNIDTHANGGQNATQPGNTQSLTVPILSTVGSTQLVIGNMGGTVVPHDGKMNIKSRPKHAVGTKTALERPTDRSKRPSGQSAHMIVPNQYVISTNTGGESNTMLDKNAGQSIIIPTTSSPSHLFRQNSSSAQVSSSLPNGIIPNSSQVYTLKSLPTSIASNCLPNSEKSPSRTSTPSPCANSTEPSPLGVHSHFTSGIQSQSAKNSSSTNNSQKSLPKKPSGVALQATSHTTATAQQVPIQLQPLQFQPNQLSHQIMANIIATDAQGKPVPILSTNQHIIPSLSFQSGQPHVVQGMMTLAGGDQSKGGQTTTAILQQQPSLALSIPQQGGNPPVRLQGQSLSSSGGQSQGVLASSSEVR